MHLGAASEKENDKGRATDRTRGSRILPNPDELRMLSFVTGSEAAGAKVRRREGNNPDYRLKAPNSMLS